MRAWEIIGRLAYIVVSPAIFVYAALSKPRTRLLIIVNDEVLVVKNWLGAGNWSLPGGGAHKNEKPIAAAMREVKEELGIDISSVEIEALGTQVSVESKLLKSKYYLFAAKLNKKPKLTLQQLEIRDATWLAVDEINQVNGIAATVRDSLQVWLKSRNLV
jgi:8-oxo-dGTP diphosphatase